MKQYTLTITSYSPSEDKKKVIEKDVVALNDEDALAFFGDKLIKESAKRKIIKARKH